MLQLPRNFTTPTTTADDAAAVSTLQHQVARLLFAMLLNRADTADVVIDKVWTDLDAALSQPDADVELSSDPSLAAAVGMLFRQPEGLVGKMLDIMVKAVRPEQAQTSQRLLYHLIAEAAMQLLATSSASTLFEAAQAILQLIPQAVTRLDAATCSSLLDSLKSAVCSPADALQHDSGRGVLDHVSAAACCVSCKSVSAHCC